MKTRTWRKAHRYLGIVIGVQLLLWTVSGMIFSWNSIGAVRGEDMIRAQNTVDLKSFQIANVNEILLRPGATGGFEDARLASASLRTMLDQPVFEMAFDTADSQSFGLFDAVSGERLSPVDSDTAKDIALADFAESVDVQSVELFEATSSHSEYRSKELPAYRVVLDHPSGAVIWVSVDRGVVTARRNNRWRVFDFFWMLHTMDYQGRDNFNSWVLKGVSIFGVITVLSGFGLWCKTARPLRRFQKKK